MRLTHAHSFMATVFAVLFLSPGNALAQQNPIVSSLSEKQDAENTRASEALLFKSKQPAPAVILLQSLVREALEQNPEIKAMQSRPSNHSSVLI